jgi:glutamate formiminotransferase
MQILEAIPNFSTSNPKVVSQLQSTIESVENVSILDIHTDPNHNRTVVTYAGQPGQVIEASYKAVKKASELIDITKHRGQHPRIGATDVLPFVPIQNITDQEAIQLSHQLGKRIAQELHIPIYFYQKASLKNEHHDLSDIRKNMNNLEPDLGPKNHPTSGSLVIGVRHPLIAYNINLKTTDVRIAKRIAQAIRSKPVRTRLPLPNTATLNKKPNPKQAHQLSKSYLARPIEEKPQEQSCMARPIEEKPQEQSYLARPTGEKPQEQSCMARPTGEKPQEQSYLARPTEEKPQEQSCMARPTGEKPQEQSCMAHPTEEKPQEHLSGAAIEETRPSTSAIPTPPRLPHLKALGVYLKEKDCAQVTMNLTDYQITNIHHAYDAVKAQAEKLKTEILDSELVGLIPQEAADDAMSHNIKLHNFSDSQILENQIRSKAAHCLTRGEHSLY